MSHSTPPAAGAGPPGGRTGIAIVFGVWTLIGLLFATSIHLASVARGRPRALVETLSVVALDVYGWALITLAVFWLVRRYPLERGRWRSSVPAYVAAGIVFAVLRALALHYLYAGLAHAGLVAADPSRTLALALYSIVAPNFVTFWLLVAAALAVDYARRYRERELRSVQLQNQLAGAQLQMLKMQLHPHFLFNTLHAVSTLVHSDPDAAERMIASLSELLRTTLAREQAQEVTLREELEFLAPYLEIEQTRLGDRLAVRTEVGPDTADALIPHLILQPLVENAVRHGIAPRREGGEIEISAARSDGSLRLVVRDNGRGMRSPGQMERPEGIGLANTRARLEQLYGAGQRFEVESAPDRGTRIEITIPFRTPAGAPPAPLAGAGR